MLHLLAYASSVARRLEKPELLKILAHARAKNDRLGVSGMLLCVESSFFQILEGEAEVLGPLYRTIAADPRHRALVKLIEEPIEKRSFANWSMGYADLSRADLAAVPGLNDFFQQRTTLGELEPGRARSLLDAFREGKWRGRLGAT